MGVVVRRYIDFLIILLIPILHCDVFSKTGGEMYCFWLG